jgi:hypothetical protein
MSTVHCPGECFPSSGENGVVVGIGIKMSNLHVQGESPACRPTLWLILTSVAINWASANLVSGNGTPRRDGS